MNDMWSKPFSYSEYITIGAGLVIVGFMLQFTVGAINWSLIAFPVNAIILSFFLLFLLAMSALRKKIYFARCLTDSRMAVTSLCFVAALTLVMGLIKQDKTSLPIGLSNMLCTWWFVLPYIWMTTVLGMTAIRHTVHFHWHDIPFLLNHWGLFICLTCATLGNADVQQLTMETFPGKPEWRALDDNGNMHQLPIAIELNEFFIEQYPAKMMVISNSTGMAIPEGKPQFVDVIEKKGTIADWSVKIEKYYEYAAPVEDNGKMKFVRWGSDGATDAALITATNIATHAKRQGWVSCGSYLFPFNVLRLDKTSSLVMAEREPKRYASSVKIYTEQEDAYTGTIEVNKPLTVKGWNIYQLDFDHEKGRWSEMSTFRLIKDPWLPSVYAGIFMMIAGAVGLFIKKKK